MRRWFGITCESYQCIVKLNFWLETAKHSLFRIVCQYVHCHPAESDCKGDFLPQVYHTVSNKMYQCGQHLTSTKKTNKTQALKSCKAASVDHPSDSAQLHTATARLGHNTNPAESLQLFSMEWKLICCHDGSWLHKGLIAAKLFSTAIS